MDAMTLASQVVCLDLARKLKELGVKQESLFAWVDGGVQGDSVIRMTEEKVSLVEASQWKDYVYSAFTVAELGEMLPKDLVTDDVIFAGEQIALRSNGHLVIQAIDCKEGKTLWQIGYQRVNEAWQYTQMDESEADCRAKMLIYLIEQGIVKP